MSWTDDRVSLLKKLWGEGRTAAEIAKELGGVTRNAVIGKAHRLKLSNRVSPIQQNKKPVIKPMERKVSEKPVVKTAMPTKSVRSDIQIKPVPDQNNTKQAVRKLDRLYPMIDLKPRMCRWPEGDPREAQFGFCGCSTIQNLPYCAEHAALAYQAATRNRILKAHGLEVPADVLLKKKIAG